MRGGVNGYLSQCPPPPPRIISDTELTLLWQLKLPRYRHTQKFGGTKVGALWKYARHSESLFESTAFVLQGDPVSVMQGTLGRHTGGGVNAALLLILARYFYVPLHSSCLTPCKCCLNIEDLDSKVTGWSLPPKYSILRVTDGTCSLAQ